MTVCRCADSDSDDDKYAIDSDEDELPFACHICREPFTNPIRTNCDHYFCLKCAMQRYKRTSTCAICKAQTGGAGLAVSWRGGESTEGEESFVFVLTQC